MDLTAPSCYFVGRQGELAALAMAHQAAASAHPGIVSIEGPPGIGKTALLRSFLANTHPPVVVFASGDEAEAALPWGVLSQLAQAPEAERCEALGRLRGLAPDVDPMAAGRLVLEAVGSLQSEGTVALVVEDLHWVDQPSARALRFALRRLTADQVLVVLTTRPEGPLQLEEGWQRLLADRGQRLRLEGLGLDETAELAAAHWTKALPPVVGRRLWEHSGGNPFYLRCLIEELDPALIETTAGPLPAPRSLAGVLISRLSGCSPPAQDLVSAAVVLGERCSLALAVALAGVTEAAGALDEAVRANLLEEAQLDGLRQVSFPHPLVRSAIYSDLSPAKRAALHLKAADLTAGAAALLHRAAAATGPDDHLADELADLAKNESSRGADGAAARHLARAADLTVQPSVREKRFLSALVRWLLAGEVHEVSLRRAGLESMPPSPRRDEVRARLAWFEGRLDDSRTALEAASRQLAASDERGVRHAPTAASVTWYMASLAMLDWNWRGALDLMQGCPESPGAFFTRAQALCLGGRTRESWDVVNQPTGRSRAGHARGLEVVARYYLMMYTDDPSGARAELEGFIDKRTAIPGSLSPFFRSILSEVYYRLGSLDDALVTAELGLSLLEGAGMGDRAIETVLALSRAVWAASAAGNWPTAKRHLRAIEAATRPDAPKVLRAHASAARWSLALARDETGEMLVAGSIFDETALAPELGVFPFGPVGAEAMWRNGRLAEADEKLDAYEVQARRLGRASALLGVARVRGLLEASRGDEKASLHTFEDGSAIAGDVPLPLEVGRFRAAYGGALATMGTRSAAVRELEEARRTFEATGARPYLERVDEQLVRLGRSTRRRSGRDDGLTPTESVVARLVSSGLSNSQVAERLVVSRKAIEYHLANIYAKLDVSSRSQLGAKLRSQGP